MAYQSIEKVYCLMSKLSKSIEEIWFEKGRMSVLRKNKSGCCCIIDDDDNVVSVCDAHKQWLSDQIFRLDKIGKPDIDVEALCQSMIHGSIIEQLNHFGGIMKTPEYQLDAEMAQILNDVTKKIGKKKPTKVRM